MANNENLKKGIATQFQSGEEAARNGAKGGKIAAQKRRQKREMREAAKTLLEMAVPPTMPKARATLAAYGFAEDEMDYNMAVLIAQINKALKGDTKAAQFLRDSAGFNPSFMLQEQQFTFEREQRSGSGVEIEDISHVVCDIWGYETWSNMLRDGVAAHLTQTIFYNFADIHLEHIRKCFSNMYNILEGAVRSGKTVDHVLAFAVEVCDTKDKFHLATGSTVANAKLNIGDCNGMGLEHIFRGQCRWGQYKGNDALIIRGPYTNFEEKVIIFAGGGLASSFQKIRGNSYGMWIATEINLHHDNTIKEAFNRTIAAQKRKIFWDLNPEHPKAQIYVNYIDPYVKKAKAGKLSGGCNYTHVTIFDNINISPERLKIIVDQYDPDSIWYIRDILGKRSIADGLIYRQLASAIAGNTDEYRMRKEQVLELIHKGDITKITCGIDFGGNGSGHAFVASAETADFSRLIALRSERYLDGEIDAQTGKRLQDIDPDKLGQLFIRFYEKILRDYGFVTKVYADSAETVLRNGIRTAMARAEHGDVVIANAQKRRINDRIFTVSTLAAQHRLFLTEDCETLEEALSMAVWNPKLVELERLDDGSSDIDTLDAFEYTFERDIGKLNKLQREGG